VDVGALFQEAFNCRAPTVTSCIEQARRPTTRLILDVHNGASFAHGDELVKVAARREIALSLVDE
jgi:hypothetical protein